VAKAPETTAAIPPKGQRSHRATYARDKQKGGYIIRVEGPSAGKFAGKVVPVTKKNGDEDMEHLDALIWSGVDDETGKPVSLYSFKPKPREEEDVIPF
jgi:hypothetical protein